MRKELGSSGADIAARGTTASRPADAGSPLEPTGGPWLIRSHYRGSWHRRGSHGGASGYAADIKDAGIFDYEIARHYNDWGSPGGRDEAVPVSRAVDELDGRLRAMRAEYELFAHQVEAIRDTLSSEAERQTSAEGRTGNPATDEPKTSNSPQPPKAEGRG